MVNPKRSTVLLVKTGGSLSTLAKANLATIKGSARYTPATTIYQRAVDIARLCEIVVIHHLGTKIPGPVREFVLEGTELTRDYFCSEWWKNSTNSNCQIALDKSRKKRDLIWFETFRHGLFHATLSNRWNDVEAICSWVDARMKPEYSAGRIEDELGYFYISLASLLRPMPIEGLSLLERKIDKCKWKRPRLLLNVLRAVRDGEKKLFLELFDVAVNHFLEILKGGPTARDWISLELSILRNVAVHLGMPKPKLIGKAEAVVVTRQSLGLR